jgi:hypothetical protein
VSDDAGGSTFGIRAEPGLGEEVQVDEAVAATSSEPVDDVENADQGANVKLLAVVDVQLLKLGEVLDGDCEDGDVQV